MAYGYVNPVTGFTIELWFKSDSNNASFRTLFNSRTQGNVTWTVGSSVGRQMLVGITQVAAGVPNAIQVMMTNEGTNSGTSVLTFNDPSGGSYANDNNWHHLAVRLLSNRSTYTVFLDGAIIGTGNTTAAVNWKPSLQTFGAEYAPHLGDRGTNLWNKWLSYIAMYEGALTDERINDHFISGSGGIVYDGDHEVDRLHRIADWADLPEQSREFDTPRVFVQGIQVAGTNALQAMQDTSFTAGGLVFADGQSRMIYHNRRHSYNRWVAAVLKESTQSAPEIGVTFTVDDRYIFNDIRGERPNGSQVRIINDDSRAAYGRKVYSFSIPVSTQTELHNTVAWLASRYKDAAVRIEGISLQADSSELIEWVGTGGVTVGDVITLEELPVTEAPEATMKFVVEKIAIDANFLGRTWKVDLELSPFTYQEVWQVGVTGLGDRHRIAW